MQRRAFAFCLLLSVAAPLWAQSNSDLTGAYTARGMQGDGKSYQGQVDIIQEGTALSFTWTINNETFTGAGLQEGRVIAVDWGAESPIVYVVMPNGELHGTWANGTAVERLVRR